MSSWSTDSTGDFVHVGAHCHRPSFIHSPCSLRPAYAPRASRHAIWRPLLHQIHFPMRASRCTTLADPPGMPAPPAVRVVRPPQLAQQRASDFVDLQPAAASTVWMASIIRTHVRSLASGFGQATRFDSSVGVATVYLFAAALEVRARLSNPRSIPLTRCYPCPERLSACDLAPSPPPHPHPHASQLTHHAC